MKYFYLLALATLIGCSSNTMNDTLPDTQLLAECQSTPSVHALEDQITAEYGFKRFTKNTYRPVVDRRLLGHKLLIVNLEDKKNKLYVEGKPLEMADHFSYFLTDMTCENERCQAPINRYQLLKIYPAKVKTKRAQDVTVIECTK